MSFEADALGFNGALDYETYFIQQPAFISLVIF